MNEAFTIGDLAEACKAPIHRIEYLVRSRKITPLMRAGRYRLYSPKVVDTLKREMAVIDQRQGGGDGTTPV